MKNPSSNDRLVERLYWLIKLRWFAVAGVVLTIFFVTKTLNISVQALPLYSVAAFLGLYNFLFLIFLNLSRKKTSPGPNVIISNTIANTQISLDLLCLACLIHFSGGIENPFIFYFIFHMIIASTLLSRKASFLQATFAAFLFSSVVVLEYLGVLSHYHLVGFIPFNLHNNLLYIFGLSFVFITTLYIAVYMATSISRRLREHERKLKEANELLNEKDRIKSEYVLRVTHDIREHLSAVQSCIEPVTKGITGALNESQRDLLFRAESRAEKLLFFVKALLEITRIKLAKEFKMESFSFSDTVNIISEDIGVRAKAKNVGFKAEIAPSIDKIKGVRVYIEEAILNLLANSVKYTPGGGEISLEVYDKGKSLLIQIKDTGIGIPKDELPRIFEEFYRASNAKEVERVGTGLGLAITKQIVEMHKGRMWVKSDEGKGSIFFIELPK